MLVLRPSSVLALLLALTPQLVAPLASAAPEPTPSEISVARRLFDEGKVAEEAGRFREAAEKFRKALAIKDTPGIRFHLARCEEEQGAFVEAILEYDRARELLDSGVKAPDVARLLPEARERVRGKVASIVVSLPDGTTDARVELDGKPLSNSVLGVPVPVNPGKHQLRASAVGRTSYVGELELGMGETKQLVIELPRASAAPPTAPVNPLPAPAPRPQTKRSEGSASDTARTVVLVSEASLFAAGITTGIVFTIAKNSADDRYETANERVLSQYGMPDPDGVACSLNLDGCAELEDARLDRRRDGAIAAVGFATAGVSALAFGLTLALWKTEPPARLQASVAPHRAVMVVSGSF